MAAGCHESLDLLTSRADAGLVRADAARPEAGRLDSSVPAPPLRVPPNPCAADADCASVGGVCEPDRSVCVECNASDDCPQRRSKCDSANRCVGCLSASDCPSGWICDALTEDCSLSCTSSDECLSPAFSVCSPTRHICVLCETDADCSRFALASGLSLRCRTNTCSECASDLDCPEARKHCDTRIGVCEECRTSDECPVGTSCVPSIPNTDFLKRCQ